MHLKGHTVKEWAGLQNLQRTEKFLSALITLPSVNNQSVDVKFWTKYHAWIDSSGLQPSVVSVSKTPVLCCNF